MHKKLLGLIFLGLLLSNCKDDDDDTGITYLSPSEQVTYDTGAINYLLAHYYIDSNGSLIKFQSCDTNDDGICDTEDSCDTNGDGKCDTADNCDINGDGKCDDDDIKIPSGAKALKDIVSPLSNGGYYAILEGKQGTGNSPTTTDSIEINYSVKLFNSVKDADVNTGYMPHIISSNGNIQTGTEAITDPSFYYYDINKFAYAYATSIGKSYKNLTKDDWTKLTQQYNDNKLYSRYVITEFVEGIQKIKSRELDKNAPLSVQAIIIAPSANSKGLEAYNSIGGLKSYFSILTIDLLNIHTR